MPNAATNRFIYQGSPFLIDPYQEIFEAIMAKRNPFMPMELTLAQELRAATVYQLPRLASQIDELRKRFGTTGDNLSIYVLGFDAPLYMIVLGHYAKAKGDATALQSMPAGDTPTLRKFNQHLKQHIKDYRTAVEQEPSGRLIFVSEENRPYSNDLYYAVGVRVAKIAYMNYAKELGADFS